MVKRGRHSVLIASGVPPTLHPSWAVRRSSAHGRYFTLRIDTLCDLGVALGDTSRLPLATGQSWACDQRFLDGRSEVRAV